MKKIGLALVIFLLIISKVSASEYFWSTEKKDDYKLIEEEKRYRFYKEEKKGEYLMKGGDSNYAYEDSDNIQYGHESEYKESCQENANKKIEYKTVYPYKKIPKAKYMQLSNIPRELKITKLDIYYHDEKISYDIESCTNCDGMTIMPAGSMLIAFDSPLVVGEIKINIEVDNSNSFAYFTYFYSEDKKLIINYKLLTTKNTYTIDSYKYQYTNFGDTYYSDEIVDKDYLNYPLEEKEMCKEIDILTYHYNLEKIYYDDNYHVSIDDSSYIKDENDYQIYYKYEKEEDPDIRDTLIEDNKKDNIEDNKKDNIEDNKKDNIEDNNFDSQNQNTEVYQIVTDDKKQESIDTSTLVPVKTGYHESNKSKLIKILFSLMFLTIFLFFLKRPRKMST